MARMEQTDLIDMAQLAEACGYDATEIARRLKISDRQLRRYSRGTLGCSLHQWLDERRLIDAIALLRAQTPMKEVAFQLGYKQLSHFCRKFKTRYGVTPSQFVNLSGKTWGTRITRE